jgi:D-glycerate 3-kinase
MVFNVNTRDQWREFPVLLPALLYCAVARLGMASAMRGSKAFETSAFIIFSHINIHTSRSPDYPLFVALQGPQGSGKTSLLERVKEMLAQNDEDHTPHRVATLSIDDLYLPHAQLKALASAHPDNPFLRGRGLPGTHDIPLGRSLLRSLKDINRSRANSICIPRFDKSLFDGEGDRLPESEWTEVQGPLDVVLLEGWCVGFYPQSRQYIEERFIDVPSVLDGTLDTSAYSLEHILDMNRRAAEYTQWWDLFDICLQVRSRSLKFLKRSLHVLTGWDFARFPLKTQHPMCRYISGAYSRSMR